MLGQPAPAESSNWSNEPRTNQQGYEASKPSEEGWQHSVPGDSRGNGKGGGQEETEWLGEVGREGRKGYVEGKGRSLLNLSSFPHRAGVLAKESGNERALGMKGQDAPVWRAPWALTFHNSLFRGTV